MQDQTNPIDWNSIFEYRDGVLYWRINRGKSKIGNAAGSLRPDGYWRVGYSGHRYRVHRIIYEMHNGEIPDCLFIDHIDGNKSNNFVANLRIATHQENKRNSVLYKNNKLGVRGVHRRNDRDTYCASIKIDGKTNHLGYFLTPELAGEAYRKAAIESHGEFYRESV